MAKHSSGPRPGPSRVIDEEIRRLQRDAIMREIRNNIIEECARVADEAAKKYEYSLEPEIAKDIAARIRALKDKS